MLRIIDGLGRPRNHPQFDASSALAFVGQGTDKYRVRAVDLGNGHVEVATSQVIDWIEAEWSPAYMADVLEVIAKAKAEADPVEVERINRERAARRATTRVRRLCKTMGADTLLTLTYRACEADLARSKADLKEFNRRMLRELPCFRFVACFERQKRGAWHMHLATAGLPVWFEKKNAYGQPYRVKSFEVFRQVWRSVTGERGGNVDVSRRKRNSKRSPAKIAAYIAKYIGKAFIEEGDKGVNRWAKYGDVEVPQLVDFGVVPSLLDALGVAYGLLSESLVIATSRLSRWKEWFFLAAEPPPR
jgi:hypothetical protein